MDKSLSIKNKLLQNMKSHYPQINIQVKALDSSGLYEVWIEELKDGTPDITNMMQQIFPEAEPFSGLGFEKNGYRQSFLIY